MPQPSGSIHYLFEETVDASGEVARQVVPQLTGGPDVAEDAGLELPDLRHHRSLSATRPATDELLIVANKAITIPAPGLFNKYRVLLRDLTRVAYIAIDKEVNVGLGGYDDVCPGGNELAEYCRAASFLSIMIDGLPSTPVEVFLYAGRFARPT